MIPTYSCDPGSAAHTSRVCSTSVCISYEERARAIKVINDQRVDSVRHVGIFPADFLPVFPVGGRRKSLYCASSSVSGEGRGGGYYSVDNIKPTDRVLVRNNAEQSNRADLTRDRSESGKELSLLPDSALKRTRNAVTQ